MPGERLDWNLGSIVLLNSQNRQFRLNGGAETANFSAALAQTSSPGTRRPDKF